MGNHHNHHNSSSNLKVAFFLNLCFTIIEIIGGIYVNSVSIISDAIHDLGDSLSLGMAWYLDIKSKKGASKTFSFGYSRFSLLGALINSIVLITGSVFVINEAIERIQNPEPSNAEGMILIAILGIFINSYAAWKMSGGNSLNEKVVTWHLMEDVLGWIAVLIVGIILKFHYNPYLDPALSILITLFIFWGVIRRLKETLFVFLQGVPKEVDLLQIEEELLSIKNIASLHHTHIWSLEGENHVFTTHLKLDNISSFNEILQIKKSAKSILKKYNFGHCTIETELINEECLMKEQ